MLKDYPKGFTLGGVHAPHVTMLQRFVKTEDLPIVYAHPNCSGFSRNWPMRSSRSRRLQELPPYSPPLPRHPISPRTLFTTSQSSFPITAEIITSLHVSIGVGTTDFLKTFSSAPFDDSTFSSAAASVYHLGEYGTAMTKLHSVPLKH
jgi:hypothetical protein